MEQVSTEMALRAQQRNGHEGLAKTLPLSPSYAARVAEIITMSRAGSPSQVVGDEFKFLIGQWVEVLAGFVPESRLNDCYLHAARTRDSSFPMSATDMCTAWKQIKEVERAMPPVGSYDWSRAREVCADCNNTGTILFVKRDGVHNRDFTYGKPCYCGKQR